MSKDTQDQIRTGFLEKQAKENSKRGTNRGIIGFILVLILAGVGFGIYKGVGILMGMQNLQHVRNTALMLKDPKVENGKAFVNVTIKNLNGYRVSNPAFKYTISTKEGKESTGEVKVNGSIPSADQRTFHHVSLGEIQGIPKRLRSDLITVEVSPPESLPKGYNQKFVTALNGENPIEALESLSQSASNYAPLLVALGIQYEGRGDWAKAKEHYAKAIEIDSNNANAHFHLGLVLLRDKEQESGMKELNTALKLAPNDPDIKNILESFQAKDDVETKPILPGS